MTELPESWCITSIGDIAHVGTGATPKRGNPTYYDNGTIPWITSSAVNHSEVSIAQEFVTEVALRETNLTLYEPGTLLVAMYGEGKTRGKCAELRIRATTNQALAAVVLLPSAAAWRKWVQYSLEYQYEETRKLASGGVQPNLNLGLIRRIEIPFAPERCQRQIIDTMESYFTRLDDATATLERVERNLKRYRASVLKAAVEGRLVPTEAALAKQEGRSYEPASVLLERILNDCRRRWSESGKKGKYEEPTPPDTTSLPDLPEGWCWTTVDQVALDVTYGSSAKTNEASEGGIPVLRMGNIVDGYLDYAELKFLPVDHFEFPELLLRAGDLLFNRTNSPELVGKSAVVATDAQVSFASYLIRVRFANGIHSQYISYFINSLTGRQWIRSVVSQQVGQANVNGSKLKACPIPLPPSTEQARIIEAVENVLSIAFAATSQARRDLDRCARLRQSILRWAFEGKLADPDPEDEPASVLLERIKAERDAGTLTKASRPQRAAKTKQVRA